MKIYGRRLRLSPEEESLIMRHRKGQVLPKTFSAQPKILIFDVETVPLGALIWQLKTGYIQPSMLEDSKNYWMLSWSAKWLFGEEIYNDTVTSKEAIDEDDKRIIKSLWEMIDEADIVISHNGKRFDHRMMNMRCLIHGFNPPSPYKIIDTLQVSRKMFALPSYKLDYMAEILGIGNKLGHPGISMWKKSMLGDEESLAMMGKYNDHDVKILEDLYLIIRPWIPNHPNIALLMESEESLCTTCGHDGLEYIGDYITSVSKFETYRCEHCGAHSRERKSTIPKQMRLALLSPTELIR